jgi:S-formylglutathione hydrolase FrmB
MRSLLLLCALVACHASPPARPEPARPPARPEPHVDGVTGHVQLVAGTKAAHTRGPLFVTWMTSDERIALLTGKASMMQLRDLITRGVVTGEIDAAAGATFTVHPAHGKMVLVGVVDSEHHGVLGLFGGAPILTGMSEAFDVTDATTKAPPINLVVQGGQHEPDICKGDRMTLETIEAPEVAGTIDTPTKRRICVRVPKDYAAKPRRHYPVVYALPGLFGTESIISDIPDVDGVIVAAIDTSTATGSTYLADSPTSGAWDTFFTTKLVPYIDAHYRTFPRARARAMVGHSTGGYNAMSYPLRHPEVIGVVGSSSPDGLDFHVWMGNGTTPAWILEFQRVEHALGGAGQFISYAADWSPKPPGYDWPFDDHGAIIDDVAARWLVNTPGEILKDPKRLAAAKVLSGRVYLTVGDTDEFGLHDPTVAFSGELTAAGIVNQIVITHGGHITHLADQLMGAMAFCASKLEPAK